MGAFGQNTRNRGQVIYVHEDAAGNAVADVGQFLTADIGGITEAAYKDDLANGGKVTIITKDGAINPAAIDHGGLGGLGDDDHPLAALVAGRAGEDQTVQGSLIATKNGGGSSAAIRSVSINPAFELRDTDAAVDEKSWDFITNAGLLSFRAANDADSVFASWLEVARTGTTVDSIAFPGGKIGPTAAQQHTLPTVASDTFALIGATQTLTNKTLTTPVIGSFANAGHNHQNAAGGATLNASAIAAGLLAKARGGTGLDTSGVLNGQLLIGNTAGNLFSLATLTEGTDISIVNAGGSITISSTASGITDHGALTGLTDDDHTQYALLAGRSGGQILVGGSAINESITLRATSNAGDGFILFETDPTTRRGMFRPSGEFLVKGADTQADVSGSVAEFGKSSNAATAVIIVNGTNGNAASSNFEVAVGSGTFGSTTRVSLFATAPSFTPANGFDADQAIVRAHNASGGLNLMTSGDEIVIIKINQVEQVRFLTDASGNGIVNGSGEGGTVAATGNIFRAPDIVTGGAGDIAGADNTIAAGIGSGIGDAAVIDFHLPIVAATGDNIQTRASRLTLDMVASTTVLTMAAAQAMTISTAAGDLTLSPAGDVLLSSTLKSSSATEIGLQVTNAALTVGSLGSVILPVKTDAGAPNDAAGGNLDGAVVVNTNEDGLYFRSGGTWKKVDKHLKGFDGWDAIFLDTPAGFLGRNGRAVATFDDGVEVADEQAYFAGVMSHDYSGGDITVDIDWVAELAVVGDVVWGVEFEAIKTDGHDIDANDFASQKLSAAVTTNAASGKKKRSTITFTNAEADAIAAGDPYRIRLTGMNSEVGYTLLDDAQFVAMNLRQA